MEKTQKIIAYLYIIAAVFLFYEGLQSWTENRSRSYILLVLSALSVFMYFLKQYLLKKNKAPRKK